MSQCLQTEDVTDVADITLICIIGPWRMQNGSNPFNVKSKMADNGQIENG